MNQNQDDKPELGPAWPNTSRKGQNPRRKTNTGQGAQVQSPGKQNRNLEIHERYKMDEETRKVGLPCSLGPGGRVFA